MSSSSEVSLLDYELYLLTLLSTSEPRQSRTVMREEQSISGGLSKARTALRDSSAVSRGDALDAFTKRLTGF
jgi:hypothetical protein